MLSNQDPVASHQSLSSFCDAKEKKHAQWILVNIVHLKQLARGSLLVYLKEGLWCNNSKQLHLWVLIFKVMLVKCQAMLSMPVSKCLKSVLLQSLGIKKMNQMKRRSQGIHLQFRLQVRMKLKINLMTIWVIFWIWLPRNHKVSTSADN